MPVFNNALAGAAGSGGADAGYKIERSLRFNDDDSAYLQRTFAQGNQKTYTWSGWVKRNSFGTRQILFGNSEHTNKEHYIDFEPDNKLLYVDWDYGSYARVKTTQVFRDPSAWYHIVVAVDTTIASPSSDRVKMYVNGVRVTEFDSTSYPAQNRAGNLNHSVNNHRIGRASNNAPYPGDFQLAEIHFIDGQALDCTSFGEFDADTGVWNPKAYSGTYGTNGFHLDFSDNSSNAALGTDSSGNNNDFTANNFSSQAGDPSYITESVLTGTIYSGAGNVEKIFDGTTATCGPGQGSSVTFTPSPAITINSTLRIRANVSNASQDAVFAINGVDKSTATAGFPASGGVVNAASTWTTISNPPSSLTSLKFGWGNHWMAVSGIEIDGVELLSDASSLDSLLDSPTNGTQSDTGVGGEVSGNYAVFNPLSTTNTGGLANGNLQHSGLTNSHATIRIPSTGKWYFEFTPTQKTAGYVMGIQALATPASPSNSNTMGVDEGGNRYNGNGSTTSSFLSAIGVGDTLGVAVDQDGDTVNFYRNGVAGGSTLTPSSLGSDVVPFIHTNSATVHVNFGQRAFAYSAPSGYKTLCTTNLPTPTIADPSTAFDVKLWTGDGSSSRAITGLNISPDLLWIKRLNSSLDHFLWDSVRGVTKELYSNQSYAEGTSTNKLASLDSNGFTVKNNSAVNANNDTYVAWAWDAGSSTVSNTDGTITTNLRANTAAGTSIATYSGSGTNGDTIGHGLGVEPDFCIIKARNKSDDWRVYHSALGTGSFLALNSANPASSGANWQSISDTTIGLQNDSAINGSGYDYVAYFFHSVPQFSKVGVYTGNGSSSNGTFVFCGFRPRFVCLKNISSSQNTGGFWVMIDTERDPSNNCDNYLQANSNATEGVTSVMDILSNGFKLTNPYTSTNGNGIEYVYFAFAESPFKYSRAR